MTNSKVITVLLVAVLSMATTSAHAVWWLAGKAVKSVTSSDSKKEKKRSYYESNSNSYRDYGSSSNQSDRYDGYNPYHQHPDGERSPYYNEKRDKAW